MAHLPRPSKKGGGAPASFLFYPALLFLLFSSTLFSCATAAAADEQFRETITLPEAAPYAILSYMDTETDELPAWLAAYLGAAGMAGKDTAGLFGIEALPEYAGKYVFIIEQRGAALPALLKWKAYFRVNQDFSHAVFLRMYARLLSESEGRPDYFFGDFFETFLKKIAGSSFRGAAVEDSFWVKTAFQRRIAPVFSPEETEPDEELLPLEYETEEEYRYYILATINRLDLQRNVRSLFSEVKSGIKLQKSHSNAVDRLEAALFAGF